MSNNIEPTLSTWEHCKKILELLKQKNFRSASSESYHMVKALYANHLKGKYVEVKGRKVPRTIVLVIALLLVYFILSLFTGSSEPISGKAFIAANAYDNNGLRVYDLRKCNSDACGIIENGTDEHYEHIRVKLLFYGQTGKIVTEGTADAWEMAPHTRAEFVVPCAEDYAYPKLDDVFINPKMEDEPDPATPQG